MISWIPATASRPRPAAALGGHGLGLLPLLLLAAPAALLIGMLTPWFSSNHHGLRVFMFVGSILLLGGSVALIRQGSLLGAYFGVYLSFSHFLGHSHVDQVVILQIWWALSAFLVSALALRGGYSIRELMHRATFWLGPASLAPFVVSGLLVGGPFFAVWRFTGWILSVGMLILLRRDAARHLAGMAAGIGIIIAVGLYAGSTGPYFDVGRFGGGEWWFTHPNVLAMITAPLVIYWFYLSPIASLRIPVVATLFVVIVLTDSRTVLGAVGIGLLLSYATGRLRIAVIGLAVAVMLLGGSRMFLTARSLDGSNTDVLTGRSTIWEASISHWKQSGIALKMFGFSTDINGLMQLDDGRRFAGHNVVIGTLMRGGVIGVVFVLVGIALLLRRARYFLHSPRGPEMKAATALIAVAIATCYTEDWLSGDTIWMAVTLAEGLILKHAADSASDDTAPAPEADLLAA